MAEFVLPEGSDDQHDGYPLDFSALNAVFQQYQIEHPDLRWLPIVFVGNAFLRVPVTEPLDPSALPPMLQHLIQPGPGVTMQKIIQQDVIFLAQTTEGERLVCKMDPQKAVRQLLRVPSNYVCLPLPAEFAIKKAEVEMKDGQLQTQKQRIEDLEGQAAYLRGRVKHLTEMISNQVRTYIVGILLMGIGAFLLGMSSCLPTGEENPPAEKKDVKKRNAAFRW